jgi:hypothetical protein
VLYIIIMFVNEGVQRGDCLSDFLNIWKLTRQLRIFVKNNRTFISGTVAYMNV